MIKFFHGKEPFLSLRRAKIQYRELRNEFPDYEAVEIDADITTSTEVMELYHTHGMFTVGKVIFLKRLYVNKDKANLIENLMENFSESIDDIRFVIWEEQKIPSNTRYFKFMKDKYTVEELPELNKRTFMTWAKDEAELLRVTMERDAIQLLAQRTNYDPERFINELEKLKLLGKEIVTANDVRKSSTDTFEYDIWNLVDSINLHDRVKLAEIMRNLLKQKVDPHYILSMIFRNTRILTMVKSMIDQSSNNKEIASKLRLPPFTVPSLMKSAEKVTIDDLKNLYKKLTNLDYQIKTGQIDAELGLTLLSTIL